MKKSLYAALAIVLFPVIAMAQCPVPTTVTATVTFKHRSASPVFSVSSNTLVLFAPGNLQYKANPVTWQFAAHQYDIIGADNAYIASDYTGWIDLFGWATSGNSASGTYYQPYSANLGRYFYGENSQSGSGEWDPAKSDWGKNILPAGTWRTLSSAEWTYLFNTRTTSATIEGVSNARFTKAKILTDGSIGTDGINYNILGVILFPDNYDGTQPEGVTWAASNINTYSYNFMGCCTCTTAGWEALEAAGCVFLPCAGSREENTVSNPGSLGYYWSSSAYDSGEANCLYFPSNVPITPVVRHIGCAVRLVQVQ